MDKKGRKKINVYYCQGINSKYANYNAPKMNVWIDSAGWSDSLRHCRPDCDEIKTQ